MGLQSGLPDWKESVEYQSLFGAQTSALAWEWLRRSNAYRSAAFAGLRSLPDPLQGPREQPGALAFGLHRFEDPRFGIPDGRPIWTAGCMRSVIVAAAMPCAADNDSFFLGSLSQFTTIARSDSCAHILLSDGLSMLRLDVAGASPWSGPVTLRYEVKGLFAARAAIPPILAFLRLAQSGSFQQHHPGSNMSRQILLLRAWDALAAGASQREIAAILLSNDAAQDRWRINHSSLRSRAQRLCKAACAMAERGFWQLLNSNGHCS